MTILVLQRQLALSKGSTVKVGLINCSYNQLCLSVQQPRRWQSSQSSNPFAARPPTPAELEIGPSCYAPKDSFLKPTLKALKPTSRRHIEIDLATTRPAVLDSPEPLNAKQFPNESIPLGDRARYLFRLGKAYLGFYKTGVRNIWANYKKLRMIQQDIPLRTLNETAKYSGQGEYSTVSRSEYQFCRRTRHDIFKTIPFGLVLAICGEFTPLVIIAIGSAAVPYTCRIPNQERDDMTKAVSRNRKYMADIATLENTTQPKSWQIEWREAYRYGLTMFRTPLPVIGSLWHQTFIRPSLIKHCDNILCDTILAQREGGFSKLGERDVYEWADKYDLYALRQYVEKNFEKGKGIDMKHMKQVIVPAIEKEARFILDQDWNRLNPAEHWRTVFRSVGSKSPDWNNRVRHIGQDDPVK